MSDFTLTPPAAPPRERNGPSVVVIRRAGVTLTVKDRAPSWVVDLVGRLMGTKPPAHVNAEHDQLNNEGERSAESNQGALFEPNAPRDDGLVSDFLADRTEFAQQFWEPIARLSAAYFRWCSNRGLESLSPYAFSQELRNLKFRQLRSRRIKCGKPACPNCAGPEKGHQTRTWEGLRLKPSDGALAVVAKPSEAAS